jgi:hypothetical protein
MTAPQKLQQSGSDDTDPCIDSSPAHGDVGSGAKAASSGGATPEPAKMHHAFATAHMPANPAGAEAYTNGLANAHANAHHQLGDKDKDQVASHTPVHDLKVRAMRSVHGAKMACCSWRTYRCTAPFRRVMLVECLS